MRTKAADSPPRGGVLFVSVAAAALLLLFFAGCRSTPTRYVLTTTLAGYHVRASLDRPATIESLDDHALITFAHHQLRIEKGQVVLDDNETAAFPVTATRIVIEVADGRLRMTADGRELWKKPFPDE